MVYQVVVRLDASSPNKAILHRMKGSPKQATESEITPPPTVRSPTRPPSYTIVTYTQRAHAVPCRLPCCWFSLCALWAQVSWFFKYSCAVLDPSGSYNPSTLSSPGFPELHLIFGCGSPHLFPSVVACWELLKMTCSPDLSMPNLLSSPKPPHYWNHPWRLLEFPEPPD